MKPTILSLVAVLALASIASADRCVGPKDHYSVVTSKGIATYTQSDILWCDDFDTYCTANDGVIPGGVWPGYPPSPDNLCPTDASASGSWFRNVTYHWPVTGYSAPSAMNPYKGDPVKGWDGNYGWPSRPFLIEQQAGSNSTQYHTFNISGAIGNKYPGSSAINGTDINPLILRWWAYTPTGVGGYPNTPHYMELRLDDDRAPTDYVEWDCNFYHECNCYWLHTDAYCDKSGVCTGGGTCKQGTCELGVCEDNVCIIGPRIGQACTLDGDCNQCSGGINTECPNGTGIECGKACSAGTHVGEECTADADCAGTCSGGTLPGVTCNTNSECYGCVNGAIAGQVCSNSHDCQRPCDYGICNAGTCESNICVGGYDPGKACTTDTDCGICTTGSNTGQPCDANNDCGFLPEARCDGGTHDGEACGTWEEDGYYPTACAGGPVYPMVVQAEYGTSIPNCPPESPCTPSDGTGAGYIIDPSPAPAVPTTIHASIAFGWFPHANEEGGGASYNPCDSGTGRKPTNYHAQTFNGKRWEDIRSNQYLPGYGDFNFAGDDGGQGFFQIKVYSTTYHLKLVAPVSNYTTVVDNEATLTRYYTGTFNKVSMGSGPGCKLASDGSCATTYDAYRYTGYSYNRYNDVSWTVAYIDRPVLLGGVGTCCDEGACCDAEGGCTYMPEDECTGTWQGLYTECDPNPCCPQVWADFDRDVDVDQTDFNQFQYCFSGSGITAPAACKCWDRNGDGDVDADDYATFATCWTGPNVPYVVGSVPSGCE